MPNLRHAALFLATCSAPGVSISVPVTEIGTYTFSVNAAGSTLTIPYDANLTLSGFYPHIERVVILLHGSSRSSANAYDTLVEAADIAGDFTSLLLAPQFLIEQDLVAHQLGPQALFWSDSGWKEGDRSLDTVAHPRPVRLSSFAIMDSMIARVSSRNPNVQTVVFAGHSAGGQFIHRFAGGSRISDAVQNAFGIEVEYKVANPSSYLYLNPERVVAGTMNQFAVPPAGTIQDCPDYNDYKYGLANRNNYMSQLSSAQIVTRFRDAHVAVLLGELDDDPAAADLDTTCAAMLQGPNRRDRGIIQASYLRDLFGASIASRHRTMIVPGIAHDAHDIFTSQCGVAELFGGAGCDPVDAPPGALGTEAARADVFLTSHPNPFRSETVIAYRMPAGNRTTTLEIHDARGALVRTWVAASDAAGRGSLVWDGRTDGGERVAAGVYWLRLRDGASTAVAKSILLR
jgi:hypothetical protein